MVDGVVMIYKVIELYVSSKVCVIVILFSSVVDWNSIRIYIFRGYVCGPLFILIYYYALSYFGCYLFLNVLFELLCLLYMLSG